MWAEPPPPALLAQWGWLALLGNEPVLPHPPSYSTKSPALQSETVHYKRGVSQQFLLPSFKIDLSDWKDDEVSLPPPPTHTHTVGLLTRALG